MAEATTRPDWFYDESVLPHPKEKIIAAIEREIIRAPNDDRVNWLRVGGEFLWNFQKGIGPDPFPLTGFDVEQLPRGADLARRDPAAHEKLRRIFADPKMKRAEARAARFKAIAQQESQEIETRLKAAVRARNARA